MTRYIGRTTAAAGLALLFVGAIDPVYGSNDTNIDCGRSVTLEKITEVIGRDSNLGKEVLASCLGQVVAGIDLRPDNAAKTDVLTLISHQYGRKGEPERALQFADQALELAVAQSDKRREAWARYERGVANFYGSEGDIALLEARLAASLFEEIDDAAGVAKSYTLVGAVHRSRSEYEESVLAHKEALTSSLRINDANGIARARNNIGLLYWNLGELDAAQDYFESVLGHYREHGPNSALVTLLSNLGLIYNEKNEPDRALRYLDEGLALAEQLDVPRTQARLISNKAYSLRKKGELAQAMNYLRECADLRESISDWWGLSRTLASIGEIHRLWGNNDDALTSYERALELAQSVDALTELAVISEVLSQIYEELGRSDDALNALRLSYDTRESINDTEALKLIALLESERDLAESALLLTQSSQRQLWLVVVATFFVIVSLQLAIYARSRSRSLETVRSHVNQLEQTKEWLEESEHRYRSIFNDATVARYLIDVESQRVIEANESASQLSEIPKSSLAELPVAYLRPEWLRDSMSNLGRLTSGDLRVSVDWYDAEEDHRFADIFFKMATQDGRTCAIVEVHDLAEERGWGAKR